jgi:hypothetical protein
LFPLLFLEEISAMPASAFASSGMEILAPAINPGRPVKKSLGLVALWSLGPPFATIEEKRGHFFRFVMNGKSETPDQQIAKERLKLSVFISTRRLGDDIDEDTPQPSRPFNLKVLRAVCNSDHPLQRQVLDA